MTTNMTTTRNANHDHRRAPRSARLAPALVVSALVATLLLWSLSAHAVAEIVGLLLLALSGYSLLYRLAATRRRPVAERNVNATILPWGGELIHTVSLRQLAPWVTVELLDGADQPHHPRGRVLSASGRGTAIWQVRRPCRYRGRWRVGPTTVRITDPLGLLPPVETQVAQPISLLVLPRVAPLRRCTFDVDSLRPGSLRGRVRSEVPPAVAGVRPFEHGDSLSRVDPYATARALSTGNGSVMVRLYDAAVEVAFWLAVDLDPVERGATRGDGRGRGTQIESLSLEAEELLVTVAASLATYLLNERMETGLVMSGALPHVLAAGSGMHQQQAILTALAEARIVEEDDHAPVGQTGQVGPRQRLPATSGSPAHPTLPHQLRLAQQHMVPGHTVLLLTAQPPAAWHVVLRTLRRQGILVQVISIGEDGERSSWGSAAILHLSEALVWPNRQADLVAELEGRARTTYAERAG